MKLRAVLKVPALVNSGPNNAINIIRWLRTHIESNLNEQFGLVSPRGNDAGPPTFIIRGIRRIQKPIAQEP